MVNVWVDSWQQQCCGEEFSVGSAVAWLVTEQNDDWLGTLLGPEDGRRTPFAEDHHGLVDDLLSLCGVVDIIEVLIHDLEPVPGETRTFRPTSGTGRLRSVNRADKWEPEPPASEGTRQAFAGWIVGVSQPDIGPAPLVDEVDG